MPLKYEEKREIMTTLTLNFSICHTYNHMTQNLIYTLRSLSYYHHLYKMQISIDCVDDELFGFNSILVSFKFSKSGIIEVSKNKLNLSE